MHTQQKALSIGTFFLLFLTLFSTAVLANPNWWTWGNVGQNYGCTSGTLPYCPYSNTIWSSNTPLTTANYTAGSIGIGTDFSPIVYDLNKDDYNEFFLFNQYDMSVVTNTYSTVGYISWTDGAICGSPSVININSDADLEVGFMTTNVTGQYFSYIYYDGTDYQVSGRILVSGDIDDCTVLGGPGFPADQIYFIASNGTISQLDLSTNTTIKQSHSTSPYNHAGNVGGGYPWFGGGTATAGAINSEYSIFYMVSNGVAMNNHYLRKFNPWTNVSTNATVGNEEHALTNFELVFGSLGNPETNPVLIGIKNFNTGQDKYFIRSASDLSEIMTLDDIEPAVADATALHFPVGADYNLDSNNEICFTRNSSTYTYLECIDVSRRPVENISFPAEYARQALAKQGAWAYLFNDTHMQYITEDYIFKVSGSNFTYFINLTDYFINTNTVPIVVNVNTEASLIELKSVVFSGEVYQHILIAEGLPGYCGNGVCEFNESVFSCFVDCGTVSIENATAEAGEVENGEMCLNDSWCYSGLCSELENRCVGRGAGATCSRDVECSSLDCDSNSVCTGQDFVQLIGQGADAFGFVSAGSKIFLALIIILITTILLASWGGVIGAVLGFSLGLIMGVLVFGWIGVWFLFGFFFIGIVGVFLYLFLGKGGES